MENKDSESKFPKNCSLRNKLSPAENANSHERVTNKSLLQFSYQMLFSLQSDENSSSENYFHRGQSSFVFLTFSSFHLVQSLSHVQLCETPNDCNAPGLPILYLLSLRVYSNSRPLSQWCHPTISSSVVPFSSCLQSFPASAPFSNESVLHIIGALASVPPMNIQGGFPLGLISP